MRKSKYSEPKEDMTKHVQQSTNSCFDSLAQALCNPNPCKNGGICKGVDGSCHCVNGMGGAFCDTKLSNSSDHFYQIPPNI